MYGNVSSSLNDLESVLNNASLYSAKIRCFARRLIVRHGIEIIVSFMNALKEAYSKLRRK